MVLIMLKAVEGTFCSGTLEVPGYKTAGGALSLPERTAVSTVNSLNLVGQKMSNGNPGCFSGFCQINSQLKEA